MLAPIAIVAVPALVVGTLTAVVAVAIGLPLPVVFSAVVVAAAPMSLWSWRRVPRTVLEAMNARPLVPVSELSHERFENIVKNLCTTHGMTEPDLHVADISNADGDAVNAASVGLGRKSIHLVLTQDALSKLDRLELEAVVARQLCEIRRGRDAATALAGVARLPGCGRLAVLLAGRIVNDPSVVSTDIEAVRLTHYPPALASAIEKSAASSGTGSSHAVAHLWMVPPDAVTASASERMSAELRIDMLGEL